jgi:hypothetical protein
MFLPLLLTAIMEVINITNILLVNMQDFKLQPRDILCLLIGK